MPNVRYPVRGVVVKMPSVRYPVTPARAKIIIDPTTIWPG